MLTKNKTALCIASVVLPIFAGVPLSVHAGQEMKCVDGTGRVIYTELSSCSEALRNAPPPPRTRQTILKEAVENEQKRQQQRKTDQQKLDQQLSDIRYKNKIDQEYRERQRLIEDCALMKIELDRRYANAAANYLDPWWRNDAVAYHKQYNLKCN